MNRKRFILVILIGVILLASIASYFIVYPHVSLQKPAKQISTFEACAAAGYPIMETYPEQCKTPDNRVFVRTIPSQGKEFGSQVILAMNEQAKFSDDLTVTLVEINDSRCKPGVVCIWAGELSPLLRITGSDVGTTPTEIRLGTVREKSVTENGYTFTLQDASLTDATIVVTKEGMPAPSPSPTPTPSPAPTPIACTQEAKQCPDGSYVGRTGKNCEFAPCPAIQPVPGSECTKDSDCPSAQYICQATQGMATACPSTDPSCVPTYVVIKGECKLKEGSRCSVDSDCVAGNLCHNAICASPVGRLCSGPNDTSCPSDYECTAGCGSPVSYPGEPPPPYYCQLRGYIRNCPICLAINTLIDTPFGAVPVQRVQKGMAVWTINRIGERIAGVVIAISRTPVAADHRMVRLILDDGRKLLVSPGHPTVDGRMIGDLIVGELYDGAHIAAANRIAYGDTATYDILPSGETGFYWANGILLDSTLHPVRGRSQSR